MSSKLAWHFQGLPSWASSVVNSDWVKVMDPGAEHKFPGRKTIGRVYIPDELTNDMISRGASGANEYYNACSAAYARAPYVFCWEGPNEPPVQTPGQRANLVAFTKRWVQLMHSRTPALRTVALCLSVGWPNIGDAPSLAGALDGTDFWAVHEYSAPTMGRDAGWLCLRYRRTVAELRAAGSRVPPLLITECGIDGGVLGYQDAKRGWRSYASRADYLGQLQWYDGELAKDDYAQAATIFTSGPNWDWTDFDVDEGLSRDLAAYIDNSRSPAPEPAPEPGPGPGKHRLALVRPLRPGVGGVSQWFGNTDQIYTDAGLAGHEGLDYWCPVGSDVLAMHDGIVTQAHEEGPYGLHVAIDGDGMGTIYAHLSALRCAKGQFVRAGDVIGTSGSSGRSNGPHLHVSWWVSGVQNPAYAGYLDPVLGRKILGDA